jgi:DNA-binding response OmpR family regulator
MSGYTGDDVLARSLLPDEADFIQKPFAPEELVMRVRTMLAQVAARPPQPRPGDGGTAGTRESSPRAH